MTNEIDVTNALIGAPGWAGLPGELRELIAEELNVQRLEDLSSFSSDLVTFIVKPNFRSLGKRFGPRTKQVAAAITAADPTVLAQTLRAGETATVEVAEVGTVELGADDVIVTPSGFLPSLA